MLDEFRSTHITWDKATSRIYSPVTANASDENGRKLVVQIVNSGQVEDLTGATLHLYWETRDKLYDGLDVFKAVDLKKGEFELSYTTGMLSNQGVLNANLVLIDTVGRVVSERFKITVTEGIDNDAIQSENSFTTLTQALIDISNLEQNYTLRLNDITAQLAEKATKGKIVSQDLSTSTDNGKIKLVNLADEVQQALTGDAPALSIISNRSITKEKYGLKSIGDNQTAFPLVRTTKSSNLFDKDSATPEHFVSAVSGTLVSNVNYNASDWIPITPETPYTVKFIDQLAFYTDQQTYISGINPSSVDAVQTIVSPVNAHYVRISVKNTNLLAQQINQGATLVGYESFNPKFKAEDLSGSVLKNIENKSIGDDKTTYPLVRTIPSTNLFDKNKITTEKFVAAGTGNLATNVSYNASSFIFVEAETQYTVRFMNQLAFYNSDMVYISGINPPGDISNKQQTITTPAYASYARISTMNSNLDTQQINKGNLLLTYQDANPKIRASDITAYETVFDWATNTFILPKNLYFLKDVEYSISAQSFNKNLFKDNDDLLFEVITPTEVLTFENTASFSSPIEVNLNTRVVGVHKNDKTTALFKPITLRFKDPETPINRSPRILFIGDSITHQNLPFYAKWWLQKFGYTPTMIGTQNNINTNYGYGLTEGVTAEKGEGKPGWRITDFTGTTVYTDPNQTKLVSPFVNPTTGDFDFNYYMSNNSFSDVDYVVIMIGTNDITGYHTYTGKVTVPTMNEILGYVPTQYQAMIDSIHAYNPNIKIGINPPPLAGYRDDFNIKANQFADLLYKTFDGTQTNVYTLASSRLPNGMFSGKTHTDGMTTTESNMSVIDPNGTMRGTLSSDVHDTETNTMLNALWSASWIINQLN